jgi:hypothetical protein
MALGSGALVCCRLAVVSVETNATQRSGRTLTWDIDLTDPNAKVKQALTARLRK